MRKYYYSRLSKEKLQETLDGYPGFLETGTEQEDVLKEVDRLLKSYGLGVILADTGGGGVFFKIVNRSQF